MFLCYWSKHKTAGGRVIIDRCIARVRRLSWMFPEDDVARLSDASFFWDKAPESVDALSITDKVGQLGLWRPFCAGPGFVKNVYLPPKLLEM